MKLEEIRKLIEAATPGPWTVFRKEYVDGMPLMDRSINGPKIGGNAHPIEAPGEARQIDADADFIAAARDLLPKLLKVAEAAEGIPVPNDLEYAEPEVRALAEALAALEAD